ncbi:hypothetical protein NPIL_65801 [Nephila pilipes]|uniref:Uncharacterized protein n=1 Tax=Nephila pilipes TaxID=299642 RepID=A0A8X6UGQ9_NEPPI|nr:hypothetical protein NPIL_13481 [Nephila pilipes]GFT38283.1 hypothetical protein NPIL_136271 [Nephila pilipes]GFT99237.1 hypothetical protein NPIL_462991 [Nephila pilipes]GFU08404.1 hypothetical protein NPIL_65801 [Nephila pilipes]
MRKSGPQTCFSQCSSGVQSTLLYTQKHQNKIKGGARIHTTLLGDKTSLASYGVANIASNFSCELIAIQEALREYINLNEEGRARGLVIYLLDAIDQMGKTCT